MTSAELEEARSAIASEIGPDVGEFTPTGKKRLFGWDDMLVLGGAFLMAFLAAFAKSAGEEAGKRLGAALVDYVAEQIKAWRSKSSEEQSVALENVAAAAAKMTAAKPELTAAISAAVEAALASVLGNEAETDIAHRISARVRQEALKILTPEAKA
ncbi:MAG: hypothetical protein ABI197_11155 [Granulicella sp.]